MMGGPPVVANRRRRGLAGWLVAGGLVLGPAPVVGLGCGNDGRVIPTEYLPPSETLTDEELIARCAEAAPDEAGEGCPEGCAPVGLFDPLTLACYSSPSESRLRGQVCAPTRGDPVPPNTILLAPGSVESVAYTHGCGADRDYPDSLTALTWLPAGWSACSGVAGEPSVCRCASDVETGEPLSKKLFFEAAACAGLDANALDPNALDCGFEEYDVFDGFDMEYLENGVCAREALRDRVPLRYATFEVFKGENFMFLPPGGGDLIYTWKHWGADPMLPWDGPTIFSNDTDACYPENYGNNFPIRRCQLKSAEYFQDCLDAADPYWPDLKNCTPPSTIDCVDVQFPWELCEEVAG